MSWLSLFLVTVLVCGIVLADPSVDDSNQEQVPITDEVDAEGRSCKGGCGSAGYPNKDYVSIKPTYLGGGLDQIGLVDDLGGLGGLGGLLGLGGLTGQGIIMIPLLAVNIVIMVLLGIITGYAQTFLDNFGTAPGFVGTAPSFVGTAPGFVGTAPGFVGTGTGGGGFGGGNGGGFGGGFGGGNGRNGDGSPVVSSYQGYDSSAYHKRSTEEARSMASPSMLSYLTKMASNAIIKYAEIDQDEE